MMPVHHSRASPSPSDSQPPRQRLGDYVRRFGAAVRRKSSSQSLASAAAIHERNDQAPPVPHLPAVIVPSSPSAFPIGPRPSLEPGRTAAASPTCGRQSSTGSDATSRASVMTGSSVVTNVERQHAQQDRAQTLYSRYGLNLSTDSFASHRSAALARPSSAEPLQRVQKRARLRMHAHCHECGTTFGAGSRCSKCHHKRCRICPRVAPKGVQQLVERTRKQLDSIGETPPAPDTASSVSSHAPYDLSQPFANLDIDAKARRTPSRQDSYPMRDVPDSPRTMESVLSASDPPMMSLDLGSELSSTVSSTASRHRDLCYTLEMATERLCERNGFNQQKLQMLFPLSFQHIAEYPPREKQHRVFRPPMLRIRQPCPSCGRALLPGRDWTCRFCIGVGNLDRGSGIGVSRSIGVF